MIWICVLLPLFGAFTNGFILRRAPKAVSHSVAVVTMLLAFAAALVQFFGFMNTDGQAQIHFGFNWIQAGTLEIPLEFIYDRLAGLLTLIVTGIGTLIHIYAGGYMHEEKRTYRFFAYLNLFVFMMMLLVLGNNLAVTFVGWEGVGLASYLLIGYWFSEEKNAMAGMKAFVVNRIGDVGFLIAIFFTYNTFGTLSYTKLQALLVTAESLPPEILAAISTITLCLFVAACGKSAQIPLYVWLPDAMAGPTPVSALIHAATMVTAGVYLMTRLSFMFYLAPGTMEVVAIVGACTALFAATIALVQTDIKKVLAYSTVSQLGFMVMACGVGAFEAGVFHLLTHAAFKALLFLGAGSVIVAMHHKQDMLEMGGLRRYLPITHGVMLVGVLAIIGFPGFAGFFSKDEILWKTFTFPGIGPYLWATGALAAACTSFYMVRLLMLTFYGDNRSDHHTREHLHETPALMWAPLVILAFLSATLGYLGLPGVIGPNLFHHYLESSVHMPALAAPMWGFLTEEHPHSLEWALMGTSVVIVILSSSFAILLYRNGPSPLALMLQSRAKGLHRLLTNKYWIDEAYDAAIVRPLDDIARFLFKTIDVAIIDGLVNAAAEVWRLGAGVLSFKMSGSLHRHSMVMTVGTICLFTLLFF